MSLIQEVEVVRRVGLIGGSGHEKRLSRGASYMLLLLCVCVGCPREAESTMPIDGPQGPPGARELTWTKEREERNDQVRGEGRE
jgi:hypothetical protein